MYIFLQALALLWGLLVLVGTNIGFWIGEHSTEFSSMKLEKAFSFFFIEYAVISMLLGFGRSTWILTWQAHDQFAYIRKVIAQECKPSTVIIMISIPLISILTALICIPNVCQDNSTLHLNFPYALDWICKETMFKFITDSYKVPQRSLRLTV